MPKTAVLHTELPEPSLGRWAAHKAFSPSSIMWARLNFEVQIIVYVPDLAGFRRVLLKKKKRNGRKKMIIEINESWLNYLLKSWIFWRIECLCAGTFLYLLPYWLIQKLKPFNKHMLPHGHSSIYDPGKHNNRKHGHMRNHFHYATVMNQSSHYSH